MNPSRLLIALALVTSILSVNARADIDPLATARAEARHELEMAKLDLRHYHQVDAPRQRRLLDAQIKFTELEIAGYKARLREYRAFDRFSTGRPLFVPLQDLRLCLLEAELRLNDLREERWAFERFRADQWRLLEMRVERARARLAELEGGGVIILGAAE